MLENGMIIGAESCDPQCKSIATGRCVYCHDCVPVYELTEFADGERVCDDCLHDYLESQGADFIVDYITENLWEYLGNWWFPSLEQDKQLSVLKAGYLAANTDTLECDYLAEDRVRFCKEDDGFLQFVKEKLL